MAEIRIGDDESLEAALRRFRRMVQREGIVAEVRRREHYVKPSVRRKNKSRAAARRRRGR